MISFWIRPGSFFVGVLCFSLAASCNVYDAKLLEISKEGVNAGGDASQSGTGGIGNSGTGGSGGSGNEESSIDQNDSGTDANTSNVEKCGDGRVTVSEKCDIGIDSKSPGACPAECSKPNGCLRWKLQGTGCTAECVSDTDISSCVNGDGCCAKGCTNATDSDCSKSCGDGIVQTDQGELCEPASAFAGSPGTNDLVCPTECKDDGDPCTTEGYSGSADNCTARCSHTKITTASLDTADSCCPAGANANTDIDCKPICGNAVREGTEECDGSEGCDAQCTSAITADQRKCMDKFSISSDACEKCYCTNCTTEALACVDSGNAITDTQCMDILKCSLQNGCVGGYCYCGTAMEPYLQTCVAGGNGPCKMQKEVAASPVPAGQSIVVTIWLDQLNTGTPNGREWAFDTCYQTNCMSICQP
jgi:hypothetical protein